MAPNPFALQQDEDQAPVNAFDPRWSMPAQPPQGPPPAPSHAVGPSPGTAPNVFAGAPSTPQVFSPLQDEEDRAVSQKGKADWQHDNPWGTENNHPGALGKIAHGLSVAGNIAGDIFAPHLMAEIPGTEANIASRQSEFGQQVNDLEKEKVADSKEEADRNYKLAQTETEQGKPELNDEKQQLAQDKLTEQGRHNQETEGVNYRRQGLDASGKPIPYDQLSDREQGAIDLKHAQEEEAQATEELRRYQADPNSPQAKAALARVQNARTNQALGWAKLGLSRDNFNLKSTGTLPGGGLANGAFIGDNGEGVGTAFQGNVKPTSTQKDAAGRAQIGEDLRGRILAQLKDPAIRSQLGPVLGREKNFQGVVGNLPPELSGLATDLTSYAAFMAGQHPVRGIGALQYFDKVVGGLGQTPEQLEGKLQSGHSTAQDVIHQGTPRVHGSNAEGGGSQFSVTAPDGSVHPFKSQAAADRFKQLAGIK